MREIFYMGSQSKRLSERPSRLFGTETGTREFVYEIGNTARRLFSLFTERRVPYVLQNLQMEYTTESTGSYACYDLVDPKKGKTIGQVQVLIEDVEGAPHVTRICAFVSNLHIPILAKIIQDITQ